MQEVSVTLEELRGILAELPDGEMLTVTPETEGTAPEGSVDDQIARGLHSGCKRGLHPYI